MSSGLGARIFVRYGSLNAIFEKIAQARLKVDPVIYLDVYEFASYSMAVCLSVLASVHSGTYGPTDRHTFL